MIDNNKSIEVEDYMENKEDILFDVTILKIEDIGRRRHTRSTRDWSSDVCSSDLVVVIYIKI